MNHFKKDIEHFLDKGTKECWEEFMVEINTDENKDYRRGFKAGLLCSHLYIKSHIGKFEDAFTEPSTD